ncbi:12613_t:CDS:1 [Ambispora gerdemannii]|uniref:12613_t:CDS:1 n=1 Tax=Ambispora gerdemannii TaxID=144530 RepID=A0A9N8VNZ5_9GLOM|nr:12613_t:CDS:1 [Ambispora gerdemannii]
MPSFNNNHTSTSRFSRQKSSHEVFTEINHSSNNDSNHQSQNNFDKNSKTSKPKLPQQSNLTKALLRDHNRRLQIQIVSDKEFVDRFTSMEGLLAQYETILAFERKQLYKKQEAAKNVPSGFLKKDKRFWEFRIENETTTFVRYGYIQEDGELKERAVQKQQHSNPSMARRFVERFIDEKLNSGYVGWTRW